VVDVERDHVEEVENVDMVVRRPRDADARRSLVNAEEGEEVARGDDDAVEREEVARGSASVVARRVRNRADASPVARENITWTMMTF
tara:strand:+ start:176 stop:436 length:261 start_codon:yes stop_codon:yes gene_type:complete